MQQKEDNIGFKTIIQALAKQLTDKVMGSLTQLGFSGRATKKPEPGAVQHSSAAIQSLKQQRVLQLIWTDTFCQPA